MAIFEWVVLNLLRLFSEFIAFLLKICSYFDNTYALFCGEKNTRYLKNLHLVMLSILLIELHFEGFST